MLKKDWSVIRITVLLYFIVLLLPLNYYFAKRSLDTIQNDATVMNQIVFISWVLPNLAATNDTNERNALTKKIDDSFETIEQIFIQYPPNKEYIALFNADNIYGSLKLSYERLKVVLNDGNSTKVCIGALNQEINAFSKITKEMISYKIEACLDRLYISILFTMISVIALIFFIRVYIKLQFLKHAIHDHVTGLYNKEYFQSVLKSAVMLAVRQDKPLSILILSISNYNNLQKSLDKKSFEKDLKEFAEIFSNFFRQSDTVCRIEKDCFVSITPDVTSANANRLSIRLQQELKSKYSSMPIEIDICIGIATYSNERATPLLEEAKKSMQVFSAISIGGAL